MGRKDGIGEFLYRLELSSGSWNSEVSSHGLCREAYLDPHERAFIACINMEKIISGDDDIDFSGLSLRDNPHVVINWKGLRGPANPPTIVDDPPKQAFVFLYSNLILSIGIDHVAVIE